MSGRHLMVTAAACALAGCGATVASQQVNTLSESDVRFERGAGEVYSLPRAVIRVHLYASPTHGLSVVLDQPVLIADTGQRFFAESAASRAASEPCSDGRAPPGSAGPYALSHRISGFHKDTLTIGVSNSLLQSISANAEEEVTETLTNLGRSVGAIMGLEALMSAQRPPTSRRGIAGSSISPRRCAAQSEGNGGRGKD